MEDANAFSVNGVTSAAMLNADRQRTQSPASAGNTDQDIADLSAVPMKKKKKTQQAPITSTPDNTYIEHQENDLYQSEGFGNEEMVDDTDQDVTDTCAVAAKKTQRTQDAPTPDTSPADDTEIEHQENFLYESEDYDNEEVVDDETIVVENDLYDQSSVVL